MKGFFNVGEVFGYFFRRKAKGEKRGFTLKAMHFVNKLSILIFLFAVGVILYRVFSS